MITYLPMLAVPVIWSLAIVYAFTRDHWRQP
jgi:hypothetical protein